MSEQSVDVVGAERPSIQAGEEASSARVRQSAATGSTLALVALAAFDAIAGASMALALSVPLLAGAFAAGVLGTVPFWLPRLTKAAPERCAEVVGLTVLLGIALTLALTTLLPVLRDDPVALEASLPLLLMAPAAYVAYLLLGRRAATQRQRMSVAERIGIALSGPPMVLTAALGVSLAVGATLGIHHVGLRADDWAPLAGKFVDRGIIPPLTLMLFFWGLLLLANKAWVLWREGRLLADAHRTGHAVLGRAHAEAVADTAASVDDFLDLVWKKSTDFYVVPRYINWAIPILGFIGTVLGISLAADGIQSIIGSRSNLSDLSSELGQAIAPLGIAFDTTLIALSLSVLLTLLQTILQRWEDKVLTGYEGWVRASSRRTDGQPSLERPSEGAP